MLKRYYRSVFGVSVGPNPIKGETVGPMFYEGIKLRANPGPICYPSQNAVVSTNQTTTTTTTTSNVLISGNSNNVASSPKVQQQHNDSAPPPSSPILKAHLSAPAKPTLLVQNPGSSPLSPTASDIKSQVRVFFPELIDDQVFVMLEVVFSEIISMIGMS